MGYAQRQTALSQHIHRLAHLACTIAYKLDLFFYVFSSSADILFHCFLECLKTHWCIVEVLDRLCQFFCRILRQKALEMTECLTTVIKILWFFYQIVACSILDEQIYSPVAVDAVNKV